jgi:L-asparaginase II
MFHPAVGLKRSQMALFDRLPRAVEPALIARSVRSGVEESVHTGDIAVVDAEGGLVARAGDPQRILFARSSMKPLQASVSLSFATFPYTDREVAVMAASHNAEWIHLQAVRTILARAGLEEADLRCPAMRPWDEQALEEDPVRRRINSDCSGKHAGMLAACRAQDWPTETYRKPEHPLQQEILRTVRRMTGLDEPTVGVDGCGVPVHGMPLRALGRIYACLTTPEAWGSMGPQVRRVTEAMRAEPYLVAGRNRVDTALMQVVPGMVAKGGAEGLLCAVSLDQGMAVAVKVRDGAHRAAGPALLRTLSLMGLIEGRQLDRLRPFASPPVLGGGDPVGRIEADFELARS